MVQAEREAYAEAKDRATRSAVKMATEVRAFGPSILLDAFGGSPILQSSLSAWYMIYRY